MRIGVEMLAPSNPKSAYRRVERDAAILGSDSRALTLLCFDELTSSLASALHADRRGSFIQRGEALLRASLALSALQAGTDPGHPLSGAMNAMFGAAERSLRSAMVRFSPGPVEAIKADFTDIRAAMSAA